MESMEFTETSVVEFLAGELVMMSTSGFSDGARPFYTTTRMQRRRAICGCVCFSLSISIDQSEFPNIKLGVYV